MQVASSQEPNEKEKALLIHLPQYYLNQLIEQIFLIYLLFDKFTKNGIQYFELSMITEIILFFFISVFLGLSQTAGVGGGPLVNIFLMLSMGYQTKLSISVTYIFLIGGSVASIWKNAAKKNPKTNKSYVILDLILLTVPTMSSGSLFGGVVKSFLSELIITLLFTILFVYLIYDIRNTLKKMKTADNKALIEVKNVKEQKNLKNHLIDAAINDLKVTVSEENQSKLRDVVKMLAGYYIFTVLVSLLRGGLRYDSAIGINPCGFFGWVILFSHLATSAYISIRTAKSLTQQQKLDHYEDSSNVVITEENVWSFLIGGFFAGLVGATLAIGGALILIPVWLKLGVDKDYCSSTTPCLILTSAMVASTIAVFNNQYEQVSSFLLIFYFILAFISSAVMKGNRYMYADILTFIANKYKLKSLVLLLLLIVVIISLIVLIPYQGMKMIDDFEDFVHFGYLC